MWVLQCFGAALIGQDCDQTLVDIKLLNYEVDLIFDYIVGLLEVQKICF